ncbi:venom peptide SjAPI-2-like [Topomyia yanbarensis]|uniref:venom peptide SjAPI-2-like n=1 Tax=Topomyia yanbarensis TaxID=2498891 RepID=UPI00273C859A|nr:venom peptide SjAPI-2-like [Topomyia yanbarensis]
MKLAVIAAVIAVFAGLANGIPYATQCSGVNEVFLTCGSACPTTCNSYRYGSQWCGLSCQRGCFCRSGYIRNSIGVCVEPIRCSGYYGNPYGYYSSGYYSSSYYGYGNVLGSAYY